MLSDGTAVCVLMKVDSSGNVDQGELTRMLGRIGSTEVEAIAVTVEWHYGEGTIADDLRQYAESGGSEYEGKR
jgi:hypothetical protein